MGMMRRRMRRRAIVGTAVVAGGAAYVGNRAGKASAQQQMAEQEAPPAYDEPAPAAAPAPAMSAGDSQIDELQKLATLKDQGILTEEEFAAKKAQILGICECGRERPRRSSQCAGGKCPRSARSGGHREEGASFGVRHRDRRRARFGLGSVFVGWYLDTRDQLPRRGGYVDQRRADGSGQAERCRLVGNDHEGRHPRRPRARSARRRPSRYSPGLHRFRRSATRSWSSVRRSASPRR